MLPLFGPMQDLNLESHSSTRPCCLCQADTADVPFKDFRDDAEWRDTIYDQATWLALHPFACQLMFQGTTEAWFSKSALTYLFHQIPTIEEELT